MEQIDTPIAISMAILAGLLAVVSLFANKASGEMISHQAKGNNLQAQANMARTKATDTWSFFQAKTLRKHMYRISRNTLHELNAGVPIQQEWLDVERRYTQEASNLKVTAKRLDDKADELQHKANLSLAQSILENKKADTLDLARLCSEIGLVLCSIALVSKRRFLWVLGIFFGATSSGIFGFVVFAL